MARLLADKDAMRRWGQPRWRRRLDGNQTSRGNHNAQTDKIQ
jgi:hypothetical protein